MNSIKILTSISICFLLYAGICFPEEDLPKIGFIKNDKANVRAGDNLNFESLCKLEKGDPVKIIGKRYSWLKIKLPKNASLYIKNDFVDVSSEDDNTGIVNASRVNLRAGPDTKYSILGQASKPEKIKILAKEGGWYKIEPIDKTSGWIHSSQISFSFNEVK